MPANEQLLGLRRCLNLHGGAAGVAVCSRACALHSPLCSRSLLSPSILPAPSPLPPSVRFLCFSCCRHLWAARRPRQVQRKHGGSLQGADDGRNNGVVASSEQEQRERETRERGMRDRRAPTGMADRFFMHHPALTAYMRHAPRSVLCIHADTHSHSHSHSHSSASWAIRPTPARSGWEASSSSSSGWWRVCSRGPWRRRGETSTSGEKQQRRTSRPSDAAAALTKRSDGCEQEARGSQHAPHAAAATIRTGASPVPFCRRGDCLPVMLLFLRHRCSDHAFRSLPLCARCSPVCPM